MQKCINGVSVLKILERNSREELLFYTEYIPHIRDVALFYSITYKRYGFNQDVYFSIGLRTLHRCLYGFLNYEDEMISFYNYWRIGFKNAVIDFLEGQEEIKLYFQGKLISIDSPYVDASGAYHDVIGVEDGKQDYSGLFEKVEKIIRADFGDKPEQVQIGLCFFIEGMNVDEINKLTGIPSRKIYYITRRIRNHLKSKIGDIY